MEDAVDVKEEDGAEDGVAARRKDIVRKAHEELRKHTQTSASMYTEVVQQCHHIQQEAPDNMSRSTSRHLRPKQEEGVEDVEVEEAELSVEEQGSEKEGGEIVEEGVEEEDAEEEGMEDAEEGVEEQPAEEEGMEDVEQGVAEQDAAEEGDHPMEDAEEPLPKKRRVVQSVALVGRRPEAKKGHRKHQSHHCHRHRHRHFRSGQGHPIHQGFHRRRLFCRTIRQFADAGDGTIASCKTNANMRTHQKNRAPSLTTEQRASAATSTSHLQDARMGVSRVLTLN